MQMAILPRVCGSGVTSQCYNAGEKAVIYNKRRDKIGFKVGAGLSMTDIVIDSLDSIIGKFINFSYQVIDDETQSCVQS